MSLAACNKKRTAGILFSWILVAACMVLIFMLSHQVELESAALSRGFLKKLIELFNLNIPHNTLRKIAHTFEYFLLAVLIFNASRLSWHKSRPYFTFLLSVFYSVTDEIHQRFIPGRGCRFSDVCIDAAGAAAGIFLCLLAVTIFNRFKRREKRCGEKPAK